MHFLKTKNVFEAEPENFKRKEVIETMTRLAK